MSCSWILGVIFCYKELVGLRRGTYGSGQATVRAFDRMRLSGKEKRTRLVTLG